LKANLWNGVRVTEPTPQPASGRARNGKDSREKGSGVIADCGRDGPLEFGTRIRNLRLTTVGHSTVCDAGGIEKGGMA